MIRESSDYVTGGAFILVAVDKYVLISVAVLPVTLVGSVI